MLQGKKKVLAAQIALGLMLAGQSQLLDCSQAYAAEKVAVLGNDQTLEGYTVVDETGWYLGTKTLIGAGTDLIITKPSADYLKNLATVDIDLVIQPGADGLKFFSGTSDIKNNVVTIGSMGAQAYGGDISIAADPAATNVGKNTLNLVDFKTKHYSAVFKMGAQGIINYQGATAGTETKTDGLKEGDSVTLDNAAAGVVFEAGTVNVTGENLGAKLVSAATEVNITGADFKAVNIGKLGTNPDIKASKAFSVSENIEGKDYDIAGMAVGGTVTVSGAKFKSSGSVAINGGGLNVDATGGYIDVGGDLKAAGNISANTYINTTGSINAGTNTVTSGGNITAGSIIASEVNAGANTVTVNNGASNVSGNITAGTVNITQNATLKANAIVKGGGAAKLTVNVNSSAAGKVLDLTEALADDVEVEVAGGSSGDGKNVIATALFNQEMGAGLSADRKSIVNSAGAKTLRPQTKSLVETQVASLTQVMGSAELLASSGYVNASQAVKEAKAEGESASVMVPYAAVGYGNIKQNSGSYVNTKNFNANIGFAKEVENKNGKLLFGPMLEYGRGNYDSHLDDGTAGNGTAQNYGLGFMARQDNNNGTYYEGSIRFGKTTSTYDSSNLWVGHNVHYDNSANYWGIHAGVGKIQKLNDKNSIDYYAKLFHTNVGGSSVTVDGSSVDFSSSKSTRTLVGARFTHKTSDVRSIYAGLAWQQEYAGDAHATISGFETPSPSIKGASAMAELGVLVAPSQSPVSFDLGVKGWAGKQQGYSFNAKMNWKF